MTTPMTRDEQADVVRRLIADLRAEGFAKISVRVTRGGTLDVDVSAEGGTVARPDFSSGRRK